MQQHQQTLPLKLRSKVSSESKEYQWLSENEEKELAQKFNIQLSDVTRDLIGKEYWSSLENIFFKKGKHHALPAVYELETTNWLYAFFDFLSTSGTPQAREVGDVELDTELTIPDTIIIKQSRPFAWLSADKNGLQRKDKIQDLQPQLIFEGFCNTYRKRANLQATSVLAYLVVAKWSEARNDWVPQIEYFNPRSLKVYLYERLRVEDRSGILQLFIPPPAGQNALIRAWWTPHSLLLEQRVNPSDMDTPHLPMHVRAVTFDGLEHQSEIRGIPGLDLRDEVAEKLEAMIEYVSLHLPPSYRVWRGVFYFKMGGDGRLYFL
eukprot:CAMPEP_0113696394 /NCGR_PEP_ID=MMETSP0038_2-20120614/21467_1 /TAXON_ID=2898 /ORGANISM="Cryptomonas paramecium" /LENGTH=320 /DNA_ID=CAMNT_0000619115 /DNA_START=69 /DNA_END=1027 /DNA_ORIENTATION=+ /assembly_acc=CAM_ASM_000170